MYNKITVSSVHVTYPSRCFLQLFIQASKGGSEIPGGVRLLLVVVRRGGLYEGLRRGSWSREGEGCETQKSLALPDPTHFQ